MPIGLLQWLGVRNISLFSLLTDEETTKDENMVLLKNSVPWILCTLLMTGCVATQKKVTTQGGSVPFEGGVSAYPGDDRITGQDSGAGQRAAGKPYSGETTGTGGMVSGAGLAEIQGPLPSMNYVNDRIFEYGRKLDRWRKMDAESAALELNQKDSETMVNCFVDLQNVLDGYNQLRADMLRLNTSSGSSLIISSANVLDLQKSDISFLESICGQLFAPESDALVDWANREADADLPQLETLIERYNDSGEYEEVIQVWLKIPAQQHDRVHLRTKILYGNALMFLHQEEKAAEMYQQIVEEMLVSEKQKTDLVSLRKMLADLYTAAGNYTAAEKQYRNISQDYRDLGSIQEWAELQLNILERSVEQGPELAKYSALLRDYLGFIPERDGYKIVWDAEKFLSEYPYSAVASNVDLIKAETERRALAWFKTYLNEINRLTEQKKYLDAIEKLETVPTDLISAEQKAQVKAKNEDLVLAEAVARETRKIEQMQELQTRWNEGMLKVEAGNYTEAIDIFKTLLQTEYYAKAQDKISELTLLAAKTDRRAAADLYIRYTKTSDIEMQKKLLTESRKLLTDILKKYPDVGIADKVKGNIQRVEQEMNALDPSLLPAIKEAERFETLGQEASQKDDDFVFTAPLDSSLSQENRVLEIKISE
jgi:hypothetical protein